MIMDVDELLTTTRSARKALDLDAPVEPSAIRECLAIAMAGRQRVQSAELAGWSSAMPHYGKRSPPFTATTICSGWAER